MWPLLFEEKLRPNLPDLIYITQENLVSTCLKDILLEENFVSKVLFEQGLRRKVLENFRGIVTTWREDEGKGTHFFWRKYPGQPRSLRMYLEGNNLVPQDPRFKHLAVSMEKQAILDLLAQGEIYPSLFTIFAVLTFYAGIRPLTGHGSAIYLQLFKEAWIKTLKGTEFGNEIKLIEEINTAGLICGPILVFKREGEKLKAPYAFDLIFDGGIKAEYLKQTLGMRFKDVLSVGLPDMYDYFKNKYIPEGEKLALSITPDDLAELSFDWIK